MGSLHHHIPASIVAGDYYDLELTFCDAPVDEGGTANFYLRGPGTLDITGSPNGNTWQFLFNSTQTANLPAGTYQYSVTVKNNGNRITVAKGWMSVAQDLSTAAAKVAFAEKMIYAIECVLTGKITADVVSLSIAGRSITKMPIQDLMALRVQFYRELTVLRNGPSGIRAVPIVFGRHRHGYHEHHKNIDERLDELL